MVIVNRPKLVDHNQHKPGSRLNPDSSLNLATPPWKILDAAIVASRAGRGETSRCASGLDRCSTLMHCPRSLFGTAVIATKVYILCLYTFHHTAAVAIDSAIPACNFRIHRRPSDHLCAAQPLLQRMSSVAVLKYHQK
jgi:hypothetical protein